MSTLLKQVGAIAGIKRVVWIDDLFATNVDLIVERIITKIPALLKAGRQLEHRALAGQNWNPDATPATFTGQVNAIVVGNKPQAVEILDGLTAQQTRDDPETPPIPADLSSAHIDMIKSAFVQVDTFTFATWQQNKEAIMSAADDSTLFLVDRDFSFEIAGGENKGLVIMKELLERPQMHGAFILMSHAFARENELVERDGFSATNNCNAGFAFISKDRLTLSGDNVDEQNNELATALQDALVRSWCHRTSDTAKEVVTRAVEDAHRQMLNQTFDDLGGGIFYLSQRDGVPETETVARIFMLAGRIALQDEMLKQSKLHSRLDTLRKITKALKYKPPPGKELSPILRAWRTREVWDPADIVNGGYAQPSCGDVYLTTSGTVRTFLLLGQPCNLAIRAEGDRNDNEALFAECFDAGAPPSGYALILDGKPCFARFDFVYPVNLRVLDAVASSITGEVKLAVKQALPVGLLLGIGAKLNKMIGSLKQAVDADTEIPFRYRTLSVSDDLKFQVTLDRQNAVYSIPLKRIGRMRSPYADAVFGALANHHTRMAFDFDFSKIPAR